MDIPTFLSNDNRSCSKLTVAEVERLERVTNNMSNDEKAVIVRKIPTVILQNEMTRRIKRDEEYKRERIQLDAKYQEEY